MMRPGDGCVPGVSPTYRVRGRVRVPTPVAHQRHVLAMAGDVLAMLDQSVAHFVLEVSDEMRNRLIEHRQYITRHGEDMPLVMYWRCSISRLRISSLRSAPRPASCGRRSMT